MIYVSCVKYQKDGKTEYLIVASKERNKDAIEEYKVRWQIETMFGCLKSRGFDFEETHLTMPEKTTLINSKNFSRSGLGKVRTVSRSCSAV